MVGAAVFGPSWDSDPGALFQPKPSRSSVTCERPQPRSRPQLRSRPHLAVRSAPIGRLRRAAGPMRRCLVGAAVPEAVAVETAGARLPGERRDLRDPRREPAGAPREPPGNLPGAAPACRGRPREVSVPSARPRGGAAGVWALPGEGSESPAWAASPAPLPPRSRGRWRTWAQPPPGPACRPPAEPRPCPSVQSDRVSVNTACAEVRRIFAMLKKNPKKTPKIKCFFKRVSAMSGSQV